MRFTTGRAVAQLIVLFALGSAAAWGQGPAGPPNPGGLPPPNAVSLKSVPLPPLNAAKYVKDQTALVQLGKALFWDMQMGSDGRTACATCHFHAGADHRIQNQTNNSISAFVADQTLSLGGFPFHQFANPDDNRSAVTYDSSAITGSQGVFRRIFADIVPGSAAENGQDAADRPTFSLNGVNVRQVGTRNSPSVINAVFNYRNLWDGRASNIFTGLTPFGVSDKAMNALVFNNGQLAPELVNIQNASLASQSVAPPMNDVEGTYSGRTWPKLGKKMLSLKPLAKQRIAPDDSVLGALANSTGPRLAPQYTYQSMAQNAFQQAYWGSDQLVDATGAVLPGRAAPASNTNEYTQAEFNFGVFWGLAIQVYEATLVSDNSPFDQFAEGQTQALSSQQQNGQNLFRRNGCAICHAGPEFTTASFSSVSRRGALQGGRNGVRVDTGFFRTGVRPITEDIGLGGVDSFGAPFSTAVQQSPNAQPAVNGLFKTPGLRNVEFTGPYFHNGGEATLEQVIDFYARGGDFPGGGTSPGIRHLNLSPDDRAALTAFLRSLSDDRVRFEQAPFDHPELCVPVGQDATHAGTDPNFPLSAADKWAGLPSVGLKGNTAPLQTFDELLQGIGSDGSRAHTLTDVCAIP